MDHPPLPPVTLDTFGECELDVIDDRVAHILRMRSGMMGERARQKEIGEELGISRERVRQLEGEGLALIRKLREEQRHQLRRPRYSRWVARGYVWNRLKRT
ncbi:MAG TPA: sigma factor-like helix-turn-helix DNA-binding protein [Solirubrobacterales bacterium]|nr:sigma factor-like helix-turn-helix DNA-binding protein [Solirubrobacterales bacterium]